MRYLSIGHICEDVTPAGKVLGGSAAYCALTARALGWDGTIVTRAKPTLDLSTLSGIDIHHLPDEHTTTFENRYAPEGRTQILHAAAATLTADDIPDAWRSADVIHLAPIAREMDPGIIHGLARTFVGVTPQGWMRRWNSRGHISKGPWEGAEDVLRKADAAVMSIEDVQGNWDILKRWARVVPVLAVTQGPRGATVFANGRSEQVPAEQVTEVDPTGAGDVFAAAFFINLQRTGDPLYSAALANRLAAVSVTRVGILGVPTADEVRETI